MNWLDWVILLAIVLSIIRGFRRGLIRTLFGAFKYFISFVLILFYAPGLGEFLTRPWNLTQNIALSIKDMVNLPGHLYNDSLQILNLNQRLSQGDFPIEEFSSSLSYIISNLEIPQALPEILNSLFNKESIIEYLLKVGPDFSSYPIENMEELVFYTLASFIAKLIAISIGSLVIIIVVFFLTHFIISLFHKISAESAKLNLANRFMGALFNGGICFLVLVLILEVITPLLCYFMIDPNQSMTFSMILNTSFHIRPWLEHALLNM
ncbi:hypothetical protein BBF96_02935 [Anoxybacter fermentans]|uniref:Colicin V production protein n=1 Tax=Anoxybacter fermentans TaxID=1323375 RepID=A0A3S9SVZ2_9FIRM|nr:CvpA family protein [Anoxybacter fermentans]AZR72438.1 hypothetical protein BBF96_02935 [Anoxybacter fermentans]